MHFILLIFLFPALTLINKNLASEPTTTQTPQVPTNELSLTFGHEVYKRENAVLIYFDVSNATTKEYRFYYFDLRAFGSLGGAEYLPRQRFVDSHNSLRIVGLHEGDYVSCLSLVDEYEAVVKPRYACYEFTLGEKTVGAHHGGNAGYLVPSLLVVAFILHTLIAIIHYIKSKNYAHKLLHRFMDVTSKSGRRKVSIGHSLRELDRELDHPHISASVQRRLSRVTIDVNPDNDSNHRDMFTLGDPTDELPLYNLPHHSRRVSLVTMEAIPEYNTNTMDSLLSMKHLIESTPWITRGDRSTSSSMRKYNNLHV